MTEKKRVTRVGSGRTKGSFSFVPATREQLEAVNANPGFKWMVSRKQIEAMGGGEVFVPKRASELEEMLLGQSVGVDTIVVARDF